MRSTFLLGFGLSSLVSALPGASSATNANNTACATGVHMIVARASTEKPGEGIIGAVASKVQSMVPGSDSEAVDYPATLVNYTASEPSGVAAMTKLIEDYTTRCPSSKIALLGYSQGAQVVADVVCGTSEPLFNSTEPLSEANSKNIVAIIMMGDPSHVPNLPQDVGNSTKNGIFNRTNTAACGKSAAITQAYCNADDEYCDSGTSLPVHVSYVQVFGTQAAQYIVDKVRGNGTSTTNTTGANGTSTSPAGGSATSAVNTSGAATFAGGFLILTYAVVLVSML